MISRETNSLRDNNRDKYSMAESTLSFSRPKSVLHYWLQLSQEPNHDFIRLLDYLSECDLGLLEIALSERDIRQLYLLPLKSYYEAHEIIISKLKYSLSHFDWILNRGLNNHIQKLAISYRSADIKVDDYNVRFPNLLEVKCWCISPAICRMLGLYSPNLHTLKIVNGADELTVEEVETVCSGCRHLKIFQISEHPDMNHIAPPHEPLSIISKFCKELEIIRLSNWDRVESDSLACLSELTNLIELELDLVYGWDSFPSSVFSCNTKLESITLAGDLSHDDIMTALPLTEACLARCMGVEGNKQ